MTTRSIIVKPGLGKYLYKQVSRLRDEHYNDTGRGLPDSAVARLAGMVPETFRRLMAQDPTDDQQRITLDNAIKLVQIFRDEKIAAFFEFPVDEQGNAIDGMDQDSLVIAALAPLLNANQQTLTKKAIQFFSSNPTAGLDDLIKALS